MCIGAEGLFAHACPRVVGGTHHGAVDFGERVDRFFDEDPFVVAEGVLYGGFRFFVGGAAVDTDAASKAGGFDDNRVSQFLDRFQSIRGILNPGGFVYRYIIHDRDAGLPAELFGADFIHADGG